MTPCICPVYIYTLLYIHYDLRSVPHPYLHMYGTTYNITIITTLSVPRQFVSSYVPSYTHTQYLPHHTHTHTPNIYIVAYEVPTSYSIYTMYMAVKHTVLTIHTIIHTRT